MGLVNDADGGMGALGLYYKAMLRIKDFHATFGRQALSKRKCRDLELWGSVDSYVTQVNNSLGRQA